MIKLLVEDYCHECPEFYPEKTGGEAYYASYQLVYLNDCIITCNELDSY